MLSVKPGWEGSDGGNTELGESAALLLLEGQPVLERRGSIRWEPLKKINWTLHSFPTCFRGSPCSLGTEQAIASGGVAACWVRPGSGGTSHSLEHVGGEGMTPQAWVL